MIAYCFCEWHCSSRISVSGRNF
ncbi:hypothetical protein [Escherichia coli]